MSSDALKFRIPDSMQLDGLLSALRERFVTVEAPSISLTRSYHDTFDWRLYQAGIVLWREIEGRKQRLVLKDRREETLGEAQQLTGKMPAFYQEFPEGRLREQVKPLLQMRALMPRADVSLTQQVFRILDEEEKTLLRLVAETYHCSTPGTKRPIPLGGWVGLLPVRGYHRALSQVQAFLTQELELDPAPSGVLDAALSAIGQTPVDYTSKLNFDFSPQEQAAAVAKKVHLHLLSTIERNIPGTLADLDSEYLHDLRVAVRRTRSALTQVKGVFPGVDLERFKERWGWVGQITGPTRDMDVYLLDYENYRDSLPAQFRGDVAPLHEFLLVHQRQAHRAMARKLRSQEFQSLLSDWRLFLETPTKAAPDAPSATLPIIEVAGRRIYKIYKRVLNEGLAIDQYSPPEALHELRKNCKKLRYLMEFFQSLYPRAEIGPLIKALKVLLDNLGDFQDMEVQAFKLRAFAHEMLEEGEVPADTLLAMGMLVDGLLKRQQKAREAFSGRFSRFAGKSNRTAFKALFSQKTVTGPAV